VTLDELIERLKQIKERGGIDPDEDYADAVELLLTYINDTRVTEIFKSIGRWYF
jgi:hypothetical protein